MTNIAQSVNDHTFSIQGKLYTELRFMHIIEPHQLRNLNQHKKYKANRPLLLFLILLISFAVWYIAKPKDLKPPTISENAAPVQNQATNPEPPKKGELKNFSAEEFRNLYRIIAYPNVQELREAPSISGNSAADKRIRDLAAQRGYRLSVIPVAPIVKLNEANLEGDDLLQEKAASGWQDLKNAATKEDIPLSIISAYRSPEYQRKLFMDRLLGRGVSVDEVANGKVDEQVIQVLKTTAPPGYSRHHSGYTIDLSCKTTTIFVSSVCYTWLSSNNYQKAKTVGWIPSYPMGTDDQGPEPEAWEYVWVGADTLKQ